jgi:hypothetical protein
MDSPETLQQRGRELRDEVFTRMTEFIDLAGIEPNCVIFAAVHVPALRALHPEQPFRLPGTFCGMQILLSGDDGDVSVGYEPIHDPNFHRS